MPASILDKLTRARVSLLLDQPFFGTLLLNLKLVEDKQSITPTMATDGTRLFWNHAFVENLSESALKTVLAHEVLHVGLRHHLRRQSRELFRWNFATDHSINLLIDDYNQTASNRGKSKPLDWAELEKDVRRDPQFKGMSAEDIYNRLPPTPTITISISGSGQGKQGSPAPGQNPHGIGGVLDAPGDESQQREEEAKWTVAMVQAVQAAKQQGKLPAELARLVDEELNPPPRWQDLLRNFVRERAKDDYSWTRPNPRYLATGFILPSLYSQRLGPIAIAVDTSGSIDEKLLNAFISETEGIMHECRPSKIMLIDCDAEVHSIRELEPTDPIPREFKGGGGTSHAPVWEALKADPPLVCICLTDMCTDFGEDPGYPVLWASYSDVDKAPFGEVIQISL